MRFLHITALALALILVAAPATAQRTVDEVLDDQEDRIAEARDLARDATDGDALVRDLGDDDDPFGDDEGLFGDGDDFFDGASGDDLFTSILTGDAFDGDGDDSIFDDGDGLFGDGDDPFNGDGFDSDLADDALRRADADADLGGFDGNVFDNDPFRDDDARFVRLLIEAARSDNETLEQNLLRALALREDLDREELQALQDAFEDDRITEDELEAFDRVLD